MNHTKKNRLLFYSGITVILLFIFMRLSIFFLKSDGFSGLSMPLLALLFGFILLDCVPLLFLQHGYIRIVKGEAMIRYYGRW